MGTDIHGVFQRRTPEGWIDVPSNFQENRHYQLFAVLAGVRNGHGFAGVKTGDPIQPIAEPRGIPEDFEWDGDDHPVSPEVWKSMRYAKSYEPGQYGYGMAWMGDHTHSWLTGAEILAWAESAPIVQKAGVIDWATWLTWDRKSTPESYCGGVSDRDVKVITRIQAEEGQTGTHVSVNWHSSLRKELAYFFDEVARLHAMHGEVRYVFGFDS